MKILVSAIAAAVCLVVGPTQAFENVKGAGARTCAEMYEYLSTASPQGRIEIETAVFAWAQGYLSGRNIDAPRESQKDLTAMVPITVVERIDGVCQNNPDLYLHEVADIIYDQLPYWSGVGA